MAGGGIPNIPGLPPVRQQQGFNPQDIEARMSLLRGAGNMYPPVGIGSPFDMSGQPGQYQQQFQGAVPTMASGRQAGLDQARSIMDNTFNQIRSGMSQMPQAQPYLDDAFNRARTAVDNAFLPTGQAGNPGRTGVGVPRQNAMIRAAGVGNTLPPGVDPRLASALFTAPDQPGAFPPDMFGQQPVDSWAAQRRAEAEALAQRLQEQAQAQRVQMPQGFGPLRGLFMNASPAAMQQFMQRVVPRMGGARVPYAGEPGGPSMASGPS